MARIDGSRTAPPRSIFREPAWCAALVASVAFAIAIRAVILFRGSVPSGIDAGYYAVQARELLLLGKLRWSDVPLVFVLDAALAKAAMVCVGWDVDTACVWATRVVDAAVAPLTAVAVFMAAWVFARGARRAILGAAAMALVVTVSPPLMRMVGDFQKQSMAYVFMAATWVSAWLAMRASHPRGRVRWAVGGVVMLGLAALTHAGTFAAAGLGAGLMVVAWTIRGGLPRRTALRTVPLVVTAVGLAYGAVWWLAPAKAKVMITFATRLLSGESGGSGGGVMPGPGGPGGPGGLGGHVAIPWGVTWSLAVVVALAFAWWVTRHLRRVEPDLVRAARADESFICGMVLTAACLTCPILGGDQLMRLALMVPVPLAFVGAFVFCDRAGVDAGGRIPAVRRLVQGPFAALVAVTLAAVAALATRGGMPDLVDAQGMADLRGWRKDLEPGHRAVVAASHGLEFWAAFAMDTHARWGSLRQEDFDHYDRFFILEERGGGRGGPGGPGGRGRPARPPGPGGMMDDDFPPSPGPPPDDAFDGFPDERSPDRPLDRPNHGPDGPRSRQNRPAEARLVKQSDRFTLWEVPASSREFFPTNAQWSSRSSSPPR